MTSQEPIPLTVLRRLEKLERESRWIKRAGLAASLLAMCAFIMGQARPSRTLEAERFVLRDAAGRMRADLGMLPYGIGPSLSLYDADGRSRVELSALKTADTNQSALTFLDEKGKMRASFGIVADRPGLALSDAEGKVIWSASPVADESSAAPAKSGPRVFLEVWSSDGVTRPEREAGPLDRETQLMRQACPSVLVVVDPENSDFTVRLTHHLAGVELLRPDNPPPDYYRDYYPWSVVRKGGEVVDTGSDNTLAGAIKQACVALVKR